MYASARPQSASARVQQFLQEDYVMDAEDAKRAAEEAAAAWSKKRRLQPTPNTRGSDASSAASATAPAAATLDQEGGAFRGPWLRPKAMPRPGRRGQEAPRTPPKSPAPTRPAPDVASGEAQQAAANPAAPAVGALAGGLPPWVHLPASMPFFGGLSGPLPAPPRPQLLISEADVAVRLTSRIQVEGTSCRPGLL